MEEQASMRNALYSSFLPLVPIEYYSVTLSLFALGVNKRLSVLGANVIYHYLCESK